MKRCVLWSAALLLGLGGCIQEYGYEHVQAQNPPPVDTTTEVGAPDTAPEVALDLGELDLCQPQCEGRNCGPDGCGGLCGKCSGNEICSAAGKCACPSAVGCLGKCCDVGQVCGANGQCCDPDCGAEFCGSDGCGTKECGNNGCGYSCGQCSATEVCNEETWKCDCLFTACGQACCGEDQVCADDSCCTPDCTGKVCGDDGCGGSCGTCAPDENECTKETCELGACVSKNLVKTCDDADPCTIDDACKSGVCTGAQKCGDDNPCTEDSCTNGECLFDPDPLDGQPCDDNDACTDNDACFGGTCVGDPIC